MTGLQIELVGHYERHMTRPFWFMFGILALVIGLIGAALPLLPTTPFLLLATFAFARSSPRLHGWLINHPRFGPPIDHWHSQRAISRKAKIMAVAVMAVTFAISVLVGVSPFVLIIQGIVLVCAATFILTRAEPTEDRMLKLDT